MNDQEIEKKVKTFFNESAKKNKGYYDSLKSLSYRTQKKVRKTTIEIINAKPQNILDAGCGIGEFSHSLAKKFPNSKIKAIDFSPALINIAQNKFARQNIEYSIGRLDNLPYPKNYFDLVVCINVLHLIPKMQLEKILKELKRITKQTLILEIKNKNNLDYPFKILREKVCTKGIIANATTVKKIKKILTNNFTLVNQKNIFKFSIISPIKILKFKRENWNQKQRDFYKENAKKYYKKFEKESAHLKNQINIFKKFIEISKITKIIEIGSGTGRFTIPFLKDDKKVTAVDISAEESKILKKTAEQKKIGQNLKIIINSVKNLKNTSEFDLAFCVHVLHHVEKINQTISAMSKMVKPGGTVACIEPNPWCLLWYPKLFLSKTEKWSIEKGMLRCAKKNLIKIFKKKGLKNIQVYHYGFIPNFLMDNFKTFQKINNYLNAMPIVKRFSATLFIKGTKK